MNKNNTIMVRPAFRGGVSFLSEPAFIAARATRNNTNIGLTLTVGCNH